LTAYDRNQDFQQPPVVIPEASDVEWPKAGYKELIPDHQLVFAKVTREQIDGYFLYRMAGNIHRVTKSVSNSKFSNLFLNKNLNRFVCNELNFEVNYFYL